MNRKIIDPYVLLGVAYDATDEEIRKGYHEKLSSCGTSPAIQQAYQQIRNVRQRSVYRYFDRNSDITHPPSLLKQEGISQQDREKLVQELAFLSEWELGRDVE